MVIEFVVKLVKNYSNSSEIIYLFGIIIQNYTLENATCELAQGGIALNEYIYE